MVLKDENYYTVFGWMRNELHLKGNDLTVYALIYSFSQDGESEFKGSISYIMEFTGAGRTTVKDILTSLEERGYITKCARNKETGATNTYRAVPRDEIGGSRKPTTPQSKIVPPVAENRPPRGQIPTTIIISDNNKDINTYSKKESKKEGRKEDKDIARARESYDEIIEQFKVPESERAGIIEFIRHCQLNGHTLTNDALYRNLDNLSTYRDEKARSAAIHDAIDKGLFRIPPSPELHYDDMGMKSWSRAATYEDIINDSLYSFDDCVKSALWDFIAYRQANGRRLTNDGLTSLCRSLIRQYKPSESGNMVKALQTAMERGYMTIKDCGSWIAETVQAARERGMALIGDDCE